MLRVRRPQGHSEKRPHRNGRSGSQPIEDSPRRPEATRGNGNNATRARLRFDDIVSRTEAHHRGTGKQAQNALRAISSLREVASLGSGSRRAREHSPARLWPISRASRTTIRERRTGIGIFGVVSLKPGRVDESCRLSGSMTAGPRAGRQGSDRTTGPFTRGGAHRLASSHQHWRRPRRATYLGGRDEEELVHRPRAGTR